MKLIVSRPGYPEFVPVHHAGARPLELAVELVDTLDTCGEHRGAALEERGLCGDLAGGGVFIFASGTGDLYLAPRCSGHAVLTRQRLESQGVGFIHLSPSIVANGPALAAEALAIDALTETLSETELRALWGDR